MAPKKTAAPPETPAAKKAKTDSKPAAPSTPSTPVDEPSKGDAKDFANFAYHNAKSKPLVAAALQAYRASKGSEKKAILAKWKADKTCSWSSEFTTTNSTEHASSTGAIRGFMTKCHTRHSPKKQSCILAGTRSPS